MPLLLSDSLRASAPVDLEPFSGGGMNGSNASGGGPVDGVGVDLMEISDDRLHTAD